MSSKSIGERSVGEVRDDTGIASVVTEITGLSEETIRVRILAAHGKKQLRKLFDDVWPWTATALGSKTVALARDVGLHEEVQWVTKASRVLVARRLNAASGRTLVRNVFGDLWPEELPAAEPSVVVERPIVAVADQAGARTDTPRPRPPEPGARDAVLSDRGGDEMILTEVDATMAPMVPHFPEPGGDDMSPTQYDSLPSVSPDIDIEPEDTSTERIMRPFDPNRIRVKLWTPTVDLVLKRLGADEIDLAPDFQRAAGIWKDKAQSQLVESLLIRIPLPAFYVDGSDEDRLVVVDGIQRLTALKRFADGDLALQGLEYLTDLEGKRFADLPRPLKRRIEETMLTVYLIDKGTPEEAKLNIFKRLNTGGEPLTAQEIRHAMNPGPVRGFLKLLAASAEFREATQDKFSDQRMTDRECALRFCAFVQTPPADYPGDGDLDHFLHTTMRSINLLTDEERGALACRFSRAMRSAWSVLGDQAFRKPKRAKARPPVNKALFEVWAVGLDARSDDDLARLAERRDRVQARFVALVHESRDFEQALSQGTGDPSKVKLRFAAIDELLRAVAS